MMQSQKKERPWLECLVGNRSLLLGLAALVAAAGLFVNSRNSDACGNVVFEATEKGNQEIKRAEQYLERGNARAAMKMASPTRNLWTKDLFQRALTVTFSAVLRDRRSSEADISAAFMLFSARMAKDAENALTKVRLAEAKLRLIGFEKGVKEELEEMHRKDLMPDAHSYRILGQLRKKSGDNKGAKDAISLCEGMSHYKSQKRLCSIALLNAVKFQKTENPAPKLWATQTNMRQSRSRGKARAPRLGILGAK